MAGAGVEVETSDPLYDLGSKAGCSGSRWTCAAASFASQMAANA